MLTLLREMSLRHLVAAPGRALLVVLGIALGVAVLVASQATSASLMSSFDDLVKRLSGRADLMIVGNESGVPGSLVTEVSEIEGVAHSAAALEIMTRFVDDDEPLLILGVDFLGDPHFLPFDPKEGEESVVEDPLVFANEPTALLITQTLARRKGLKQDSAVELITSEGAKTFHVRGIVEDTGPAASFGGQVAVMFIDAAQVSFSRGTLVDRIDVAMAPGADIDDLEGRIGQVVQQYAIVERPDQVGARLLSISEPLRNGLQLSGLVALLVGMFIIYNAIGISVVERRKEVGLLRSLGVKKRTVIAHFCLEAMALAIPGVALGMVLAQTFVMLAHDQTLDVINRVYVATPSVPAITPDLLVQGMIAGFGSALVAAFLPARRGAAMDPIQAFRASARMVSSDTIPYRTLAVIGIVLIGLARFPASTATTLGGAVATLLNVGGAAMVAPALVVLVRRLLMRPTEALFGLPARLGLDNVERRLGRSVVNVLALMVAVSMSVAVGGWLNSVEHSIRDWFESVTAAELTVTSGSQFVDRRNIQLSPASLEKLAGARGVEVVQPVRIMEQRFGSDVFSLIASDTQGYIEQAAAKGKPWRVIRGRSPIASNELHDEQLIVLGENTANKLGLDVGDSMQLPTPSGMTTFRVRAIVIDYSSEHGAGFIDRRYYLQHWGDDALDAINLYLAADADVDAVALDVRKRLGDSERLFVTKTTQLRERFVSLVRETFSYTRVLELIVLFIALLGVVGTMVSAVLDRQREIGMLRAIGTTRAQLTASVVFEAAFLGFCACVGGVLTGTLQCVLFLETLALDQSGWHVDFMFPWASTMRIVILVTLTAAISGYLPGLRAARLNIRDALAYE